ncbi:Fur family transcriptional regulator [Cupriavidus gilardii]|uniref:Fur family transcriptional regulator n=1 Tax=Cupriavidus gilardii TaxID=82541 RepID=UPI00157253A4|nr:Fur family transcriptional regulator [Cupriavidus gilardii]NSX05335.1 transcriptional repressor [Cupriavidus gilardii]
MSTPTPSLPAAVDAAQERLRALGARVTQPRVCILACLIDSGLPLTHQAVIDRLPGGADAIDRVTVYRVLDWLVEQGLAQKRAGNDRVFRFSLIEHEAARAEVHRRHSHFHCSRCDRTFCLDAESAPPRQAAPRVPSGFAVEHVELTVNGICAECGAHTVADAPAHGAADGGTDRAADASPNPGEPTCPN